MLSKQHSLKIKFLRKSDNIRAAKTPILYGTLQIGVLNRQPGDPPFWVFLIQEWLRSERSLTKAGGTGHFEDTQLMRRLVLRRADSRRPV